MKLAAVASRANTTSGEKEDVLNEELTKDTVRVYSHMGCI